ncbi:MAG: hypothetical protein AABY22_31670 [Nanoarchaeota archaeon]
MTKLPISLVFFTSTRGHWGSKTIYLDILNRLNNTIPLSNFGVLYAHIKVSPGEEQIAENMELELKSRGFVVEKTVAAWNRGISHQISYLEDIRKASMSPIVNSMPYVFWLEDDSTVECHKDNPFKVLYRMIEFLSNPEIISVRFLRRGDVSTTPILKQEKDYFFNPHVNFQPLLLRQHDFYIANKLIEDNWAQLSNLQCELVMRMALNQLSRSQFNHIVWNIDYAETFHLGTELYVKEGKV